MHKRRQHDEPGPRRGSAKPRRVGQNSSAQVGQYSWTQPRRAASSRRSRWNAARDCPVKRRNCRRKVRSGIAAAVAIMWTLSDLARFSRMNAMALATPRGTGISAQAGPYGRAARWAVPSLICRTPREAERIHGSSLTDRLQPHLTAAVPQALSAEFRPMRTACGEAAALGTRAAAKGATRPTSINAECPLSGPPAGSMSDQHGSTAAVRDECPNCRV